MQENVTIKVSEEALRWACRKAAEENITVPRHSGGNDAGSPGARLGINPQQVQRYEATGYESASFARILKVVRALGLSSPKRYGWLVTVAHVPISMLYPGVALPGARNW